MGHRESFEHPFNSYTAHAPWLSRGLSTQKFLGSFRPRIKLSNLGLRPTSRFERSWVAPLRNLWKLNIRSCPYEDSTSSTSQHYSQSPARYLTRAVSYIYFALTSSSPPLIIFFTLWLFFTGSLFFDIAHYTLHKFSKCQSKILRRIGYLHEVHHLYFNRRLKFNDRYLWQNTAFELPLELGCQLVGTLLGYLAFHALHLTGPGLLSWDLLTLVLDFEIIRSIVVAALEGMDSNHMCYDGVVPKDPNAFVVGQEFHAMHHVDPSAYISSSFRVFDWAMGTACTLRGRRVAINGAGGSFGGAVKRALEGGRVSCVRGLGVGVDAAAIEVLADSDILILASGLQDTTCVEAVTLIELFKQHRKARPGSLLLPEVWYVANESDPSMLSEGSPPKASSQPFLRHARKYYDDAGLVYRHIVTSSLKTRTDSEADAAEHTVESALWWIRRGARYVPWSCSRSAILEYLKFLYRFEKAP